MLDAKQSFASIARAIGKDRLTISKEIRAHLTFKRTGGLGKAFVDYIIFSGCDRFGSGTGILIENYAA